MKVALIARSTLYSAKGGDTIQMVNMASYLGKLGIRAEIKLSNELTDYSSYDILHFFNIGRPADILLHVTRSRKPFVVSPNLVDYSEYDKYHRKGITGFLLSWLSMNSAEYIKTIARWILGKDKLVSKQYLWKGHRKSIRDVLSRAALVLPGTILEYERLIKLYKITPPFQLVPNGVNTSLFSYLSTRQKEENIVLCAARIEGIKNQVNLIKALNNSPYKVIIAGSAAPNQPGYYRKCRKLAADNIFFVDHLSQEELLSYYQKAKVHILPSWFETCGLSTLEAGMAGCNVVITDKGYTYEYFADHAFYCDPSSPDSIRKAVDKAFLKSQSGQLRERISSRYTWPLAAGSTFSAYKKAIAGSRKLRIGILGTRGIPNYYGGFEQFAEHLSVGLVEKGHQVTVYNSHRHPYTQDNWKGVQVVHCYDPEYLIGTAGQFVYDFNCIMDSHKRDFDIILMLGYTSSSVWGWLFPKKPHVLFNMDGLEWQRSKYTRLTRRFLGYAEKLAVKFGDHHIADSIVVQSFLKEKYQMRCDYIGYGAELLNNENESLLAAYGVKKYNYFILMARMEPENNIEIILEGFSASTSGKKMLVIGNTDNKLGKHLLARFKKDTRIVFTGAIFNNAQKIHTLKRFSWLYFHGHSVGGTNPSLLEAMASRALIAAHANPFNEAILNENAYYFSESAHVTSLVEHVTRGEKEDRMIAGNLHRVQQEFTWPLIVGQYEAYMLRCLNREMEEMETSRKTGVSLITTA